MRRLRRTYECDGVDGFPNAEGSVSLVKIDDLVCEMKKKSPDFNCSVSVEFGI